MSDDSTTLGSEKTPTLKKSTKKAARKKSNGKAKETKQSRNYPSITLEKCLVIAQKIKELNGGNAWSPKEVSKAIKVGDTNKFYYYSAASRDFGLTQGTRDAKEISLTDLGRQLVYAPNPETEHEKKLAHE